MKLRLGFVSNSSSSSFVVAFPRIPASADEVHDMMFPKGETAFNPYGFAVSSRDAAKSVYECLIDTEGPLKPEAVTGQIRRGHFDGHPEFPHHTWDLPKEEQDAVWAKYEADCEAAAGEAAKKFLTTLGECALFHFEFSDNDGDYWSVMEHGGIFENLPHIRISHH